MPGRMNPTIWEYAASVMTWAAFMRASSEGDLTARSPSTRPVVSDVYKRQFVDCAAYWALYCELEEDAGFITLDLTINNLRASSGEGVVTIESGVVKRGGSICLTEAEARDERGRLLVHCLSKQYLSPTLQPISMAVREMGFDPLPPKFLDD